MSTRAFRALLLMCVSIASLAGCGGAIKAPDLFILKRTGSVPGANLTVLINDEGTVHCNGGPPHSLSDAQLIQARAIQEELHDYALRNEHLPPGSGSVLSYYLRDEDGTVRFSDNSPKRPAVFSRLALLTLKVSQQVCHLRM